MHSPKSYAAAWWQLTWDRQPGTPAGAWLYFRGQTLLGAPPFLSSEWQAVSNKNLLSHALLEDFLEDARMPFEQVWRGPGMLWWLLATGQVVQAGDTAGGPSSRPHHGAGRPAQPSIRPWLILKENGRRAYRLRGRPAADRGQPESLASFST